MKKKYLIIIIILLLSTGCWNYNELNTISIISSIAIDKNKDGYEISILVSNSINNNMIYSATGKTISEAFNNINLENPKKNYLGHLSSVIISEDVSKEGISHILNFLLNSKETTKRFYLTISRNCKAKKILKHISPSTIFSTENIKNINNATTYSEFIDKMLKKGIEPTLPTIEITKNNNLKIGPIAIFKNDKLKKIANINILNKTLLKINCKKGYFVVKIKNINYKVSLNDKFILLNTDSNGEIIENTCSKESINKLKRKTNIMLNSYLEKNIINTQNNLKLDIFGFGNNIYKNNPKKFRKIKDWNSFFSKTKIKIKTNVNL